VSKDFPHPPLSWSPLSHWARVFLQVRIDLAKSDFLCCYFNHNKAVIFFFFLEEKMNARPGEGMRKRAESGKILETDKSLTRRW